MNIDIPEGANVHIVIGKMPALALTDQLDLPERSRAWRFAGATFKVAVVGLLVIGSFWVGEQRGQAANDYAGIAAPPPVEQAFPSPAGPSQAGPSQAAAAPPPAAAPDQVPPDGVPPDGVPPDGVPPNFAAQLQQPPTIQPPPGQSPGSGSGDKNPFGLDTSN